METIDEAKKIISDMNNFFINLDSAQKAAEKDFETEELKQVDLLHEIEISKLNAIERMFVYNKLYMTRKARRKAKDRIKLIKTLKGFADIYINKGICRELQQAMHNLESLEKEIAERKYSPRILKDLKYGEYKSEDK